MCTGSDQAPGSAAEALRAAGASLDYLTGPAAELPAAACGQALTALGGVQARFTVAHADMAVIDRIIDLTLAALDGGWHRDPGAGPRDGGPAGHDPPAAGLPAAALWATVPAAHRARC
jgi:hypothetical protein